MKPILLFAAGFLIPFGIGEVVLQVADPYHFAEKEDWTQYGMRIIDPSTNRLRPGAVASYLGRDTVISSQGWRSPEFAIRKPDDVCRVLVLGGSVPFGWGVEQGDEFPRVLERMLNDSRLAAPRRVEVINSGVPGWKLREVGEFLEREGLRWQPDIVVLTLVATDVPTERDVVVRSPFLDDGLRRSRMLRAIENRFVFNTAGSQGKPYDAYAHLSDAGLDEVARFAIPAFAELCRKARAHPVVFDTLGRDRIRDACAALHVDRIEGYTSWKQRRAWEVAVTDAHPNADGHLALARMVFEGLRAESLWRKR